MDITQPQQSSSSQRGESSQLSGLGLCLSATFPSDHIPLVLQFSIRDNLTATQLAHVFFDSGILDDPSMVETLLVSLESKPALDISAFVAEFVARASQVRYSPMLWICWEMPAHRNVVLVQRTARTASCRNYQASAHMDLENIFPELVPLSNALLHTHPYSCHSKN